MVRRRARRVVAAARAGDPALAKGILPAFLSRPSAGNEGAFPDQVIEDIVSNMIGAGSDSSAVALTWSIFLLAEVPMVREAIEAEVDAHLGNEEAWAATLEKLVWTRAVIEEAMRLFPPVPLIGRMARRDDRLNDLEIPAGTTIMIAPWVLHRHTRLWRRPEHFDPERFLPANREAIPRFAYLPFGAGPRGCLGAAFAMQEAMIALATLVKHLRFERADDRPIRLRQCITLQTYDPILIRAKRRP
jgi:cytochrome P450